MNLVDALASFNRKERYWLIRNALGPSSARLDDAFRDQLKLVIDQEVAPDAWWAMDYHLDWLIGALKLVADDKSMHQVRPNSSNLVTGSQQDMDLVVAFHNVLVLIEAKGETAWCNEQFKRKVVRLEAMRNAGLWPESIKVFLVLMSPRPPDRLKAGADPWQTWMCDGNGRPRHITLEMDEKLLKVTRCDEISAQSDSKGTSWKIVPARGVAKPEEG